MRIIRKLCRLALVIFLANGWATFANAQDASGFTSQMLPSVGAPVFNQPWTSSRLTLDSDAVASQRYTQNFEAGAMFLSRSGAGSQTLAVDQDDNPLLDASDLTSDMAAGFFIKAGLLNISPTRPLDLEFEMFKINQFTARNTVTADQVIKLFVGAVPITPTDSETYVYVSDLENYELNWRYRCASRLRLLAGLRYYRFDEDFNSFGTASLGPTGTPTGFFSSTSNKMVGGQVGAAATLWQNDFWSLYGSAKHAFLHNRVNGQANAVDVIGDELRIDYRDKTASRLWDIEIGAFTTITEHVGLKGGYRGLIGRDMALAPDQNDNFNVFDQTGSVEYSNPQWHGFFLTLEAVF